MDATTIHPADLICIWGPKRIWFECKPYLTWSKRSLHNKEERERHLSKENEFKCLTSPAARYFISYLETSCSCLCACLGSYNMPCRPLRRIPFAFGLELLFATGVFSSIGNRRGAILWIKTSPWTSQRITRRKYTRKKDVQCVLELRKVSQNVSEELLIALRVPLCVSDLSSEPEDNGATEKKK